MTYTAIEQANYVDTVSPNHEIDANLYMTLPEGTDTSVIFPRLKKTTYSLNESQESDLDKPTTMAASIAAIGINTELRRSTMMATQWKP